MAIEVNMDDKDMQKILELIGLTKLESKVYLVLLNEGPSIANNISRKSGVHRRSIYDLLDRLADKGLVNYIIENKKRMFAATDPKRLAEIVDEKQSGLKKIMPMLEQRFSEEKEGPETTFFKGKEGLKSVFEDQINEGQEIWIIGGSKKAHKTLKYYFPYYDKRRVEKGIKVRMILDSAAKEDKDIMAIPLKEVRFFSHSLEGNTSTCIYGSKIAIIVWSDNPVAVLIKNSEVAKSYKANFRMLWGIYKP